MICCLKTIPDLNGLWGVLDNFVDKTSRYALRFHGEEAATIAVKSTDLRIARREEEEAWWRERSYPLRTRRTRQRRTCTRRTCTARCLARRTKRKTQKCTGTTARGTNDCTWSGVGMSRTHRCEDNAVKFEAESRRIHCACEQVQTGVGLRGPQTMFKWKW